MDEKTAARASPVIFIASLEVAVGHTFRVSAIAPVMLMPPRIFCSAPTLRSYLSSAVAVQRVYPAMRLVLVVFRLNFAD